jgi:hypothetical protein
MLRRLVTLVLLAVTAMATGCVSGRGFLPDRGRDAADIFTACVGLGGGARARVGPLHAGLILSVRSVGLRGGDFGDARGFQHDTELLCFSDEAFDPVAGADRGKSLVAGGDGIEIPFVTTLVGPYRERGRSAFPHYYYSQIEIQLGLLLVPRLGLNPGELLDFILGWTTVDIFDDDLEARKRESGRAEGGNRPPLAGSPAATPPCLLIWRSFSGQRLVPAASLPAFA